MEQNQWTFFMFFMYFDSSQLPEKQMTAKVYSLFFSAVFLPQNVR